ncbi:MAG: DinB family protein, partial [Chloroflexi bacterium]|nr:DinB family protein [Chloroflexota bacterium]
MNCQDLRHALRSVRQQTLERFTDLPPARLRDQRSWRGAQDTLQFRLAWLAEGDETRRIRVIETLRRLGRVLSVAEEAVVVGAESRGRLLGTLIGLSDEQFEAPPGPEEWNARRVLGHVIATDMRYAIAVRYALQRARTGGTGPLRPPDAELPPRTGEAQAEGTRAEVMERLQATRDGIIALLAATPDELLGAPTNWLQWDLDVRFRTHRFSAHDREHTIQLRKLRQDLGLTQTEPQFLLADAQAARCALESFLFFVDDDLLEREPLGGGPTL